MTEELDNKLCADFPKIFRDRNKSPRETCLCWGLPNDGWEPIIRLFCELAQNHVDQSRKVRLRYLKLKRIYNKGIKNPIFLREYIEKQFCTYKEPYRTNNIDIWLANPEKIYQTWDKKEPFACSQVIAAQVKEKFGTLCFYYEGGDSYIRGLCTFMESMSGTICEECGAKGKIRAVGWIRCLCDEHVKLK